MTNPRLINRAIPAVSLALLAALAASACGSSDPGTTVAADPSAPTGADAPVAAEAEATDLPDACSLLTVDDLKTITGRTYGAGTGTDYDNTCRFDTSSERVTVSVSELDGLDVAEPIGIEVAPVDGLDGATRVDAVVYVELDGFWLSVGTGLPGFAASDLDATAAEELAKIAVGRL